MVRCLVAAVAVVSAGAAARAGGPPPVYVVPESVTVSPADGATPERVTIRGAFIRQEKDRGGKYGPPVAGVVCLGLDEEKADACRAEWKQWARAAGTGRSVAVGMCGEGGALLTVAIHKPGEAVAAPDAVYVPGHLGKTDRQEWEDIEPVQQLLAFVKGRRVARADPAPAAGK